MLSTINHLIAWYKLFNKEIRKFLFFKIYSRNFRVYSKAGPTPSPEEFPKLFWLATLPEEFTKPKLESKIGDEEMERGGNFYIHIIYMISAWFFITYHLELIQSENISCTLSFAYGYSTALITINLKIGELVKI